MEQTKKKPLRVLVGDDQISIQGSFPHRWFLRTYGSLAEFEFSDNPVDFIRKAKIGNYDALLIDLNWEDADFTRKYKTGFRVLEEVRNYCPIRILHTSDEELMKRGYQYGATHCIEKNKPLGLLEKALRGESI